MCASGLMVEISRASVFALKLLPNFYGLVEIFRRVNVHDRARVHDVAVDVRAEDIPVLGRGTAHHKLWARDVNGALLPVHGVLCPDALATEVRAVGAPERCLKERLERGRRADGYASASARPPHFVRRDRRRNNAFQSVAARAEDVADTSVNILRKAERARGPKIH